MIFKPKVEGKVDRDWARSGAFGWMGGGGGGRSWKLNPELRTLSKCGWSFTPEPGTGSVTFSFFCVCQSSTSEPFLLSLCRPIVQNPLVFAFTLLNSKDCFFLFFFLSIFAGCHGHWCFFALVKKAWIYSCYQAVFIFSGPHDTPRWSSITTPLHCRLSKLPCFFSWLPTWLVVNSCGKRLSQG